MPAAADLVGQRFHMLVVLRLHSSARRRMWLCQCDCGRTTVLDTTRLRSGNTRSCGCLYRSVQRAGDGPACARPARGETAPRTGTSRGYLAHHYAGEPPCQSCVEGHRQHHRDRRASDPDRALQSNLYTRYRLSIERYRALLEQQGGTCAICQVEASRDPRAKRFHVDHDHSCCPGDKSCGRCVRGLLCHACNTALGNFADDPERLRRALSYLARRPREHADLVQRHEPG